MSDIKKSLDEHFDGVDTQRQLELTRKNAQRQIRTLEEKQFEILKKSTIEPSMIAVRDKLLSRNLPAEIVYRYESPGSTDDFYIALHASNDAQEVQKIKSDPRFRVSFRLFIGKIYVNASRILRGNTPKDRYEEAFEMDKVDQELTDDLLMRWLKAEFPG